MSKPITVEIKAPEQKDQKETKKMPQLLNTGIQQLKPDYYYHLGLDSSMDLKKMFGDVKYVLMAGSAARAKDMIEGVAEVLGHGLPTGLSFTPIGKTERYSLFKCGPVISVSHGMGKPSCSILLHEVTKMLAAAGVSDPIYIRVGTCGGLGVKPGTVVISTGAVNGLLSNQFPLVSLGKVIHRPALIDNTLARAIYESRGDLPCEMGITMSTDDFYEGQGRVDGAICEHTLDDKMAFLKKAFDFGVRNIEMEVDCVAAFCTKLNIRFAAACVVIVNRLEGDQVSVTPAQIHQFTNNLLNVVLRFLQKQEQIGANPAVCVSPRAHQDLFYYHSQIPTLSLDDHHTAATPAAPASAASSPVVTAQK